MPNILNDNIFIIRVDASESIGLGHLTRCLLIANFIKGKGCEVVFITAQLLSKNIIESKGFKCHKFGSKIPNLIDFYHSFSIIADINSEAIFNNNVDYINHLNFIGRDAKLLITLEDLADYPYCSDLVIIPYCGADKLKLNDDCKTIYLLGPNYFPLRKEFDNESFVVSKNAKKVLITMGGSDPKKITLKVLDSISNSEKQYEILVVLGQASSITDKDIDNVIGNYNGLFKVIREAKNISELMLASDVTITNSGLTKYELSALGVPCIIISNNPQQALYSEDFSNYGSSIHLGSSNVVNERCIKESCEDLMQNYELRLRMSKKGKVLIDSNGLQRIGKELLNHNDKDYYAEDRME